jgi:hypothetical protein
MALPIEHTNLGACVGKRRVVSITSITSATPQIYGTMQVSN